MLPSEYRLFTGLASWRMCGALWRDSIPHPLSLHEPDDGAPACSRLKPCMSTIRLRSKSNRAGQRERISRQHAGAPVHCPDSRPIVGGFPMNRRFPKTGNPEALVPVTGTVDHPHALWSVHRIQSAVEPAHSITLALFINAALTPNTLWSAVSRHRFGYLSPGTAGSLLSPLTAAPLRGFPNRQAVGMPKSHGNSNAMRIWRPVPSPCSYGPVRTMPAAIPFAPLNSAGSEACATRFRGSKRESFGEISPRSRRRGKRERARGHSTPQTPTRDSTRTCAPGLSKRIAHAHRHGRAGLELVLAAQ